MPQDERTGCLGLCPRVWNNQPRGRPSLRWCWLRYLQSLAALVVLVACGGGDAGSGAQLKITPPSLELPKGLTQQLRAAVTSSGYTTTDVTNEAVWLSSMPGVVAVNASGLVTALTEGAAVISATYFDGVSDVTVGAAVTVTAAVVQAISVIPSPAYAGVALSVSLTALGAYSDGRTADVSALARWSSDTPSVATAEGGAGVVTGVRPGSSLISATIDGASATTPVTILANAWSPTGTLARASSAHDAVLLLDGRILIASSPSGPNQLYEFRTQTWSMTSSSGMPSVGGERYVLLQDGKVLMVGGVSTDIGIVYSSVSYLFDPSTEQWLKTGNLLRGRVGHSLTSLPNGKILAAGGFHERAGGVLASAEIYDPTTGSWTATGSLVNPRDGHTATRLRDGRVLVIGGNSAGSAEIYDPLTGIWALTSSPVNGGSFHSATLLKDGRVMMIDGATGLVQCYDPVAAVWTPTGSLTTVRYGHTTTLLPNGRVLVSGGRSATQLNSLTYASAELYDPLLGTWSVTGSLGQPRYWHSATLLPGGAVLVAGGRDGISDLSTAELFWVR